jgi:hypothetical protein
MEAEASEGYVILTLKYEREGNKWVGTCHELSTTHSQGHSSDASRN